MRNQEGRARPPSPSYTINARRQSAEKHKKEIPKQWKHTLRAERQWDTHPPQSLEGASATDQPPVPFHTLHTLHIVHPTKARFRVLSLARVPFAQWILVRFEQVCDIVKSVESLFVSNNRRHRGALCLS